MATQAQQQRENNMQTARKALLLILQPGQRITGLELPVNKKNHYVQFLTVGPKGHEHEGRIIDLTNDAHILLNSGIASKGYYKGGAELSRDRHGSVRGAINHAVEMLGHFLYGSTEEAGFIAEYM